MRMLIIAAWLVRVLTLGRFALVRVADIEEKIVDGWSVRKVVRRRWMIARDYRRA
jgi:hypothetical protein